MSDPRHPTKVIIVVEKGCVNGIFCDRDPGNVAFYVADYDNLNPESDCDTHGRPRSFNEEICWVDTPKVRAIINKERR